MLSVSSFAVLAGIFNAIPSHHELAGNLKQVLARCEIDYVLDVGANCGHFALMLRKLIMLATSCHLSQCLKHIWT